MGFLCLPCMGVPLGCSARASHFCGNSLFQKLQGDMASRSGTPQTAHARKSVGDRPTALGSPTFLPLLSPVFPQINLIKWAGVFPQSCLSYISSRKWAQHFHLQVEKCHQWPNRLGWTRLVFKKKKGKEKSKCFPNLIIPERNCKWSNN